MTTNSRPLSALRGRMALSILPWPVLIFLSQLVILLALYIHFRVSSSLYWAKRNVPHLKPILLLGNLWRTNISENLFSVLEELHLKHKDKKLLGLWMFTKPQLLVMDVEMAKRILIRDFNYFGNRGLDVNEKLDPLSAHIFLLNGKRWKNLRMKLTPTFSSGRMKFMFPAMAKCGDELQKFLRASSDTGDSVEVKDLLARYTTDVIASVGFGLESNSIWNPNSDFRQHGRKLFSFDFKRAVYTTLAFFYPQILKLFSIPLIPKDTSRFFVDAVRDTVAYREKNNLTRNDFLQLLIQMVRSGKVQNLDESGAGAEDDEGSLSLMEATAQCFMFFAAGFETSSSAMMYTLYELALHPEIQAKVHDEMDEKLKVEGFTYEAMCSMEYLDMVVHESLRKHPPLSVMQRVSTADYHIPEMNATIHKGTMVFLSVRGFHHDPELYPDPERFDPERFAPEERRKRRGGSFFAFGEGPRTCIGNRFGLMKVKIGLISVLREYTVETAETTPTELVFGVRDLTMSPVGGMPLTFRKRNQ